MTTVADRIKVGVVALGGGFMISRYAKAAGEDMGLGGAWAPYFAGRCGVLGDVDAGVVAAALYFRPADYVRQQWEIALAATTPQAAAVRYAQACQEWGRAKLAGLDGLGRLAELAGVLVAGAEIGGQPLFAGWRALPLPADDEARAAQLLHLLREHRGGLHVAAVMTSGLTPLQAVLAGPGGESNAAFFMWPPPYEDVSGLAGERRAVEEQTDRMVARDYAILGDAEQAELADLVDKAVAHVHPRATLDGS